MSFGSVLEFIGLTGAFKAAPVEARRGKLLRTRSFSKGGASEARRVSVGRTTGALGEGSRLFIPQLIETSYRKFYRKLAQSPAKSGVSCRTSCWFLRSARWLTWVLTNEFLSDARILLGASYPFFWNP